jgi:serine/threonine protein kinase
MEWNPSLPILSTTSPTRFDSIWNTGADSPTDCVQIGLSLATALAHLHEQGLVHRDIKPSNVIFVNGVAKLGDIGLVTEAGDTQSIVGAEGYLCPIARKLQISPASVHKLVKGAGGSQRLKAATLRRSDVMLCPIDRASTLLKANGHNQLVINALNRPPPPAGTHHP